MDYKKKIPIFDPEMGSIEVAKDTWEKRVGFHRVEV